MSQVQEIKDRLDIIEVIGQKMSLTRSGKNFRGVCPFHSEKTPSFFVSPELQRFICFGCHKQGDVFTFIQEFDRLTFGETLEVLAQKAGVTLEKKWSDPQEDQRRNLFAILELAQKYYSYLLTEHKIGQPGRDYLQERKLHADTRKLFGLGYAPESWDSLVNYLHQKKNYSLPDIEAAGLAIHSAKNNSYYDRFRGRLMFPLHDHRGRVVGFSGRLLNADAKEAKYINSPETMLYHKRFLLYGYWQNLDSIREKEAVIITEGEFDVLSSVQAHINHIVAVKGSALTEDQIRTLARTVQTIYLALDADSAGVDATKRAISLVQAFPVALRVIPVAGGKDVDDLAKSDPKAWRELTKHHISAFEYILDVTKKSLDMNSAQGQKEFTNTLLAVVASIEHPVERSFYLKQLAEQLKVSESLMEEQWQQYQRAQQAKQLGQKHTRPDNEKREKEQDDALGRYLLQLLLHFPAETLPHLMRWSSEWLSLPGYQRIIKLAQDQYSKDQEKFSWRMLSKQLPEELGSLLSTLYLEELPLENGLVEREVAVTIAQLEQRWRKNQIDKVAKQLEELEKKPALTEEEEQAYRHLQQELQQLTRIPQEENY